MQAVVSCLVMQRFSDTWQMELIVDILQERSANLHGKKPAETVAVEAANQVCPSDTDKDGV